MSDQPKVINGASEVGMNTLPMNISVEIEMVVGVED